MTAPRAGAVNYCSRSPYLVTAAAGSAQAASARALAVPYAWATAGLPDRASFSATVFSYSYRVLHAIRAPREIAVPRYTFPRGYWARVRGATVTSGANAPLLDLRSKPRARIVEVTVGRRS